LGQIFNPIDLTSSGPGDCQASRAVLGIPNDSLVVAWHGRISIHKKGLDILLDAWESLSSGHSDQDLRLLLIGSGDGDVELRQRLKRMPVRGLTWIDQFIHNPDIIRRYLTAADVYAFPSRYEGFPVALIEAMACGLPVVATEIDGVMDILAGGESDGGILVPGGDPASLALALSRFLKDESWRHSVGISARRRVEMRCSYEIVGEQLHSFLFKQ
jgi:glycosyltransferase involved in cell wall biosynthesis